MAGKAYRDIVDRHVQVLAKTALALGLVEKGTVWRVEAGSERREAPWKLWVEVGGISVLAPFLEPPGNLGPTGRVAVMVVDTAEKTLRFGALHGMEAMNCVE